MSDEKPLHVKVAEALGWQDTYEAQDKTRWIGFAPKPWATHPPWTVWMDIPRYDTDWSATGPLIERYNIGLGFRANWWWAHVESHIYGKESAIQDGGASPLTAVCNLILALKEAGKLK